MRLIVPLRLIDPAAHYQLGGDEVWPRNIFAPIVFLWDIMMSARLLDSGTHVVEENDRLYLEVRRREGPRNRVRIRANGAEPLVVALRQTDDPHLRKIETLLRETRIGELIDRLEVLDIQVERLTGYTDKAARTRGQIE